MFIRLAKGVGLFALLGIFFLAGCGGGGGTGSKTQFRVMNAVPDQTSITVLLDGTSVASSVAYGAANNYAQTDSGSRHLQVEASAVTTTFLDQTINLSGGTTTTLVVANKSNNAGGILLTDDTTAPTTGNIKLRLMNASPDIGGAVDVYVVAPGTNLNNATPSASNLTFESASSYLQLSAGTYNIAFTPVGSKFAVLFAGPVTFNAGQNRTIIAINNLAGNFTIATLNDLN